MDSLKTPPLPALPMQLMLAMGTWLSSPSVSACANTGLLPWKLPLQNLRDQQKLTQAVAAEAGKRANSLLGGIIRYLDTPYTRTVAEPPAIWKLGNARMLDYSRGSAFSGVVLFVPSLINRYYILDLDKERSLLRYLAAQGVYTLALDWGEPGSFERQFDCKRYITDILLPAIEFIHKTTGQPVTLAGYCMGGILALAAAQLKPNLVHGLALLATPWDFHCESFRPFVLSSQWHRAIESLVTAEDTLSGDIILSLFYWTEPWVFEQKFRKFARLASGSRAAEDFVALERWVNDGVPMTASVARECLVDWAQKNVTGTHRWMVQNQYISPEKLKMPVFIAIPENDHVVPHDCAMPLVGSIKNSVVIHPSAGHVGMIVGQRAKKELWDKLVKWVRTDCCIAA